MIENSLEWSRLVLCVMGVMIGATVTVLHFGDFVYIYKHSLNGEKSLLTRERLLVSVILLFVLLVELRKAWQLSMFHATTYMGGVMETTLAIDGIVLAGALIIGNLVRLNSRWVIVRKERERQRHDATPLS
jgi:hypothetical protein